MNQNPVIEAAPFFVMRTALWPLRRFTSWSKSPESGPPLPAGEHAAKLRGELQEMARDPLFREALFLASPDLVQALPNWYESPLSAKGSRAERAVVKYFSRMCGRATPFGLFASSSVGMIGSRSWLGVQPSERCLRHVRPDMAFLGRVVSALGSDPAIARELIYMPNTSLYPLAGRLHYYEARPGGQATVHHLVAIDAPDYLQAVLARAACGAKFDDLTGALVDDQTGLDEAEGFVLELVRSQILVPMLEPAVTGPEPLAQLHEQLSGLGHPQARSAAWDLGLVRKELAALDGTAIGTAAGEMECLAERLGGLPALREHRPAFQVDLTRPAPEAELGSEVLSELVAAITLLWKLHPPPVDPFAIFKEAFRERYGRREVPLTEVLDEECGIGFGARAQPPGPDHPLLRALSPEDGPGPREESPWGPWEAWLSPRLMDCHASGRTCLEFTEKDLVPFFASRPGALPPTLSVVAELAASSQSELDAGRFSLFLMGGSGPSCLNILGRFCHCDPSLTRQVEAFLRTEEAHWPEAVHAEIVHLPEGRAGNIVLRPTFREYEIPFLGRSGLDPGRQLPVADLLVSLAGERVVLRSRRLEREVVPWLTNAHAYQMQPFAMYRFLCQLQYQSPCGNLGWNWGALGNLPFLPRVVVGRTILSKARWLVRIEELASAIGAAGPDQRMDAVHAWLASRRLPRFLVLVDGDNRLPLDLHNPLSVDVFLELAKGRAGVTLMELYPTPDDLGVHAPDGGLVHELLVPFTVHADPQPTLVPEAATGSVVRHFPPGDEWLYGKIYAGHSRADRLLRETLADLVEQTMISGDADKWFFIRYADPSPHLRLRFHGEPGRLLGQVLPRLRQALEPHLASGLITGFQLDTYEPEWERYGGQAGMPCCERIFQADSECAMALLGRPDGEAGPGVRWRLALASSDRLLRDFGFRLPDRLRLMAEIRDGFRVEARERPHAEARYAGLFRQERRELEALLWYPPGTCWEPVKAILDRRSAMIAVPAAGLRSLVGAPGGPSLDGILASLLHMSCNRLLVAAQRPQEQVIAELLVRAYHGRIRRREKEPPQAEVLSLTS